MESGVDKTIVFLSFILIGILLKTKFKSREELDGIKKIILNLALPATIFIALLSIEIQWNLALLPFSCFRPKPFLVLGNTPGFTYYGYSCENFGISDGSFIDTVSGTRTFLLSFRSGIFRRNLFG